MRILFVGSDMMQTRSGLAEDHEFAFFNGFDENDYDVSDCITGFESLESAIDVFRPDLAVIGVRNFRKNMPEYECLLMQRHVPVLIQKFRLRRMSDFDQIVHCHRITGTPVYIGESYRLDERTITLKSLLDRNAIGRLEYVRWDCGINGEVCEWEQSYENLALEDLAFHHFSVMEALFGLDIKSVCSNSCSPVKGLPSRGTIADTILSYHSGLLIEHNIDWHNSLLNTDFYGNIQLEGELGGIHLCGRDIRLKLWGREVTIVPLAKSKAQTVLKQTVAYRAGNSASEPVTLERFRNVMHTIRCALESANNGYMVFPGKV